MKKSTYRSPLSSASVSFCLSLLSLSFLEVLLSPSFLKRIIIHTLTYPHFHSPDCSLHRYKILLKAVFPKSLFFVFRQTPKFASLDISNKLTVDQYMACETLTNISMIHIVMASKTRTTNILGPPTNPSDNVTYFSHGNKYPSRNYKDETNQPSYIRMNSIKHLEKAGDTQSPGGECHPWNSITNVSVLNFSGNLQKNFLRWVCALKSWTRWIHLFHHTYWFLSSS